MENSTGTSIAGNNGSKTSVAPDNGNATAPGTGTSVASGTGTSVAQGTGTSVAGGGGAPAASQPSSAIPTLPEYIINGRKFICVKPIGQVSGEGRVFIVENGGNKFAMKLYIKGHTPDAKVLDAVKDAAGGFLITLREHGLWSNPMQPANVHYYELMDYMPGGSLGDVRIKDDATFKVVALGMASCIKQCHDIGFIHRDVKPENFLLTSHQIDPKAKKVQFVLSDFGIGRSFAGHHTIETDLGKTGRYASPEACYSSDNVTAEVGPATDYYSMGMSLLAMCFGVDRFGMICSDKELNSYKLKGSVMDELGSMLKLSDHSKSLIAALLEFDSDSRAGYEEFKKWYNGATLTTKSQAATVENASSSFRIVFNEEKNQIATSTEQLAKMMIENIPYAMGFMYRGTLVRALERVGRTKLAGDIDDIVERIYPGKADQETGVYAACLRLDPAMSFVASNGKKYSTLKEISQLLIDESYIKSDGTKLGRRAHPLWAYFSVRGDANVAKLCEKFQPIIEQDKEGGIYALAKTLDPTIPYINREGKPMTDMRKIAEYLWNDRKNASYYGNKYNKLWTYLRHAGKNWASLSDKYPSLIADHGAYELYALVLQLDEDTPLYGFDNVRCSDAKEIADELWRKSADYKNELTKPYHYLWQYMRTWSGAEWTRIANEYPAKIAKDSNVWFYDLIYRLDSSKPYVIKCLDNKWYNVSTFDELLNKAYKDGLSNVTLGFFREPDFLTWLTLRPEKKDAQRAPILEKAVKDSSAFSDEQAGWYILYTIAPELSLTMQRDSKKRDYVATTEQIGEALNLDANHKWSPGGVGAAINFTEEFVSLSFPKSRIASFMRARKMGAYIDGIKQIADLNTNINQHPSAPYDRWNAIWKIVDYLGATPVFVTSRGEQIRSLADFDIDTVSDIDIKNGLPQFMSLFFHEKKGAAFSFDKLTAYFEFLEHNIPSAYNVQSSAYERNRIFSEINHRNKSWKSLSITRKLVYIFGLLPMILAVGAILYISFTSGEQVLHNVFESIGDVAKIVMAVVGGLVGLAGGIIGAVVGAIAGYWLTALLFSLLASIAPYIIAAIFMCVTIVLMVKLYKKSSDTYIPDKKTYDDLYNQAKAYIVCDGLGTAKRAFGNMDIDPSERFSKSAAKAKEQRSSAIYTAVGMFFTTLIAVACAYGLWNAVDTEIAREATEQNESYVDPVSALYGTYEGTIGSKGETLKITVKPCSITGYPFQGTVKRGRNGSKEFKGEYDYGTGEMRLFVETNGTAIRDNCYSLKIVGGEVTGTYSPYTGAKKSQVTMLKITE